MAIVDERRKWERIPVLLEATYRKEEDESVLSEAAELLDINHRGCRILARDPFKRGDVLAINVTLSSEGQFQKLNMTAVTVWSNETPMNGAFETGVKFVIDYPASEEENHKLLEFCRLNNPGYKENS